MLLAAEKVARRVACWEWRRAAQTAETMAAPLGWTVLRLAERLDNERASKWAVGRVHAMAGTWAGS